MENDKSDPTLCDLHPTKQYEFFCYAHNTFVCSMCICQHVDCQVKGQFAALEIIYQKFLSNRENVLAEYKKKLKQLKENSHQLKDKQIVLDGLQHSDLNSIEMFFEDIKRTAETMKQSAFSNYKKHFKQIIDKVEKRVNNLNALLDNYEELESKLMKMNEDLSALTEMKKKQYNSIFLEKQLNEIKNDLQKKSQISMVNEDLEYLLNKEEVFSELGQLTQKYSNLETKLFVFMKEQFPDMLLTKTGKDSFEQDSPDLTTEENKRKFLEFEEDIGQVLDAYMFEKSVEHPIVHQLRYSSNEMYTFDTQKKKFSEFSLFTSKDYDEPFIIFNNCCSVIVKNHLIFLFGGEDPENNEKSSKRSFCLNLSNKTKDNKVVVYELNEMLNARQEMTACCVGNYVYLISGYNSNLYKDKRVISKCEKFDLKTKKFYEIRDINYPRQWASSINVDNNHVYTFGGFNPGYMNMDVDKIEKFIIKLNDWVVLKFNILDSVEYTPGIKGAAFRMNETDVVILGGSRDGHYSSDYYIFDLKKHVMVKKSEKNLFKDPDEFTNQNNLLWSGDSLCLFSGNFANRIYKVTNNPARNNPLNIETISLN